LRYELGFVLAMVLRRRAPGTTRWPPRPSGPQTPQDGCSGRSGAKPDPLTGTISAPSEATVRRALAQIGVSDLQ